MSTARLALPVFAAAALQAAPNTVQFINFDDLSTNVAGSAFFSTYHNGYAAYTYKGLAWEGNATSYTSVFVLDSLKFTGVASKAAVAGQPNYGQLNGLVSPRNVLQMEHGTAISALNGGYFDFGSGYFTSYWDNSANVTLSGYRDGVLVNTATFGVTSFSPTLQTLNWTGLSRIIVSGTDAGGTILDDLSFVVNSTSAAQPNIPPVPEPSTYSFLGLGVLALAVVARRRRRA